MGKINLLDDRLINQIAAGEVVENPASVIKELVENSIDAGSTSVTIEFSKGGTEYIRIIDNGCGMDEEDAHTAFLRHATSKVSSSDDLQHIATMGFRGEALASISEVSRVELTTSTGDIGTQIIMRGGIQESERKLGFPRGTTIEVSNLFFNTPARKKFLKSLRQETNNILELCSKLILAHPDIAFKVVNSGRVEMRSDANGDMLDAICSVYGANIKDEVVPVSKTTNGIKITGYVSKPAYAELNRRKQSFFVNGRYVKSSLIAMALDEAFKGKLMVNKFPFAVLYINLAYSEVDVNVHPQKTEVRFSNTKAVFGAVMSAVEQALMPDDVLPEMKFEDETENESAKIVRAPDVEIQISNKFDDVEPKKDSRFDVPTKVTPQPHIEVKKEEAFDSIPNINDVKLKKDDVIVAPVANEPKDVKSSSEAKSSGAEITAKFVLRESRTDFEVIQPKSKESKQNFADKAEESIFEEPRNFSVDFKVCGVLWDTYILVQSDDLCCIIDQHAAHERFLYDKYLSDFNAKKVAIQQLLIPEVIDAEPAVIDLIGENTEIFEQLGFDIEIFGNNSCVIRGVPSVTCNAPSRTVFNEALELMKQNLSAENVVRDIVCPELMKSACKHAVKGNQRLSDSEIRFIVEALRSLKGLTCPHGRPIAITISRKEMEKRFGRIQ